MRNQPIREIEEKRASDEKLFWQSFYSANESSELADWQTIGPIACAPEIRFHYNAVENSIIYALAKLFPFPPMRRFYPQTQNKRDWRVLDVGSGAGHWIHFYREFYHARVTGIELSPKMADMLQANYPLESIMQADITEPFEVPPVDIVNAIGVMFHICDDDRWSAAIGNLAANLKQGGYMLVGGEFGDETEDVQFHKTDNFMSWNDHDMTKSPANLVNKRIRSLAYWTETAKAHGLEVVDLIRTDVPPEVRTPENNLLVLHKSA